MQAQSPLMRGQGEDDGELSALLPLILARLGLGGGQDEGVAMGMTGMAPGPGPMQAQSMGMPGMGPRGPMPGMPSAEDWVRQEGFYGAPDDGMQAGGMVDYSAPPPPGGFGGDMPMLAGVPPGAARGDRGGPGGPPAFASVPGNRPRRQRPQRRAQQTPRRGY